MKKTYKTETPCECGSFDLEIEHGGSKPAYDQRGECPSCGKRFNSSQINKQFCWIHVKILKED